MVFLSQRANPVARSFLSRTQGRESQFRTKWNKWKGVIPEYCIFSSECLKDCNCTLCSYFQLFVVATQSDLFRNETVASETVFTSIASPGIRQGALLSPIIPTRALYNFSDCDLDSISSTFPHSQTAERS